MWGVPPPHKIFLCSSSSSLPIVCLNFQQTIVGISISIHFRTVVANSNNFQTRPVCNLFSTNEINPSENIFNNNVMQNVISKIVKSWRFNQFLLKSGRLEPHYIDAGSIIYVNCFKPEKGERINNIHFYFIKLVVVATLYLEGHTLAKCPLSPIITLSWRAALFSHSPEENVLLRLKSTLVIAHAEGAACHLCTNCSGVFHYIF